MKKPGASWRKFVVGFRYTVRNAHSTIVTVG